MFGFGGGELKEEIYWEVLDLDGSVVGGLLCIR